MAERKLRADHVGEHRTAFERNRIKLLKTASVCGICHQPLEPGYKYPHPLSIVIDHIIPISKGGHPSDISNLQAAHRWCNRQKADKLFAVDTQVADDSSYSKVDLPQHVDWKGYF